MYFVAVELPALGISRGMLGHFTELLQQRIPIGVAGELLEILSHKLVNALTQGFCSPARNLNHFVVNG